MSHAPADLFVYGTLMEDRVVERVLGRPFARTLPALLPDYRRFRVAGQTYPGVAPAPGRSVAGLLVADAGAHLAALDRFEGPPYQRRPLEVVCGSETRPCFAYVLRPEYPGLFTDEDWDFGDFLASGDLERFLALYPGLGAGD